MSGTVSVLFHCDCVEAVDPAADDVLLAVADRFHREGLEATFKLTGERARQIRERGRLDVIDALKCQDIGYYSNYHVGQPNPTAYLADHGWHEGVAEFLRREVPGHDSVCFLAGRIPSSYGNDCWTAQAYAALQRWGTRVHLSKESFIQNDHRPFFYGGRLNISRLGPNWIDVGPEFIEPGQAEHVLDQIGRRVVALKQPAGVVCVRLYPEDLLYRTWREEPSPHRRSTAQTETGLANLADLLQRVRHLDDAVVQSARQVVDRFADISYEHRISMEVLKEIARVAATGEHRAFAYDAGYLSPSEQLFLLTAAWDESHKKGKPIRNSTAQTPLGPAEFAATDTSVKGIHRGELMELIHSVQEFIRKNNQLPSSVQVADGVIAVRDLLATLAGGFLESLEAADLPLRKGTLADRDRVQTEYAQESCRVANLPEALCSTHQLDFARLQLWTYKPVLGITG